GSGPFPRGEHRSGAVGVGLEGRIIDDEDAVLRYTGVETVDQGSMDGVGDDDLAVGVANVSGQLRPSPGRIDTHDHSAGQRRRPQEKEIVGSVVEKDSDMERPALMVLAQP